MRSGSASLLPPDLFHSCPSNLTIHLPVSSVRCYLVSVQFLDVAGLFLSFLLHLLGPAAQVPGSLAGLTIGTISIHHCDDHDIIKGSRAAFCTLPALCLLLAYAWGVCKRTVCAWRRHGAGRATYGGIFCPQPSCQVPSHVHCLLPLHWVPSLRSSFSGLSVWGCFLPAGSQPHLLPGPSNR